VAASFLLCCFDFFGVRALTSLYYVITFFFCLISFVNKGSFLVAFFVVVVVKKS
jgi:hypothetical protein